MFYCFSVVSLICIVGCLLLLSSKLYAQNIQALVPQTGVLLKVDMSKWQKKSQAWYTDHDPMKRRKQMREMTRALKRSCYYCHTRNFKRYTEVKDITLQMMVISHQQQIKCADCHQGQRGLTKVGALSLLMWRYSVSQNKQCHDCHQERSQFKKLKLDLTENLVPMWNLLRDQAIQLKLSNQTINTMIGNKQSWKKKYSKQMIKTSENIKETTSQ
jgi:hypothetical protein